MILDSNYLSESHRQIFLLSEPLDGENLRLFKAWTTRFNLNGIAEKRLMVRMQVERTPEEPAVAMGMHPRLGQKSQLGQLEPEILHLICDLAYY